MKRGSFEVFETTMLFEVLISVLVGGILFWALFSFNDLSFTNQKYVSEDLKQIENLMDSMPGDVEINYPVFGISVMEDVDGDIHLIEDESCELKIVKKEGEVSYEC